MIGGLRGLWVKARLDSSETIVRAMITTLQDQAGHAASMLAGPLTAAARRRWERALDTARTRLSRIGDGEAPWAVVT